MKHALYITVLVSCGLLACAFVATAQVAVQWDKTLGGNSSDEPLKIISTDDGGYLLAGQSISNASGEKSEDSKGSYDYWIVKIDEQGNKQWDKTLGGNTYDYLQSATLTADGGYLLVGSSGSDASGDKSENSKGGGSDFWIVKIDEQGNKVWDKTLGGNQYDGCNDVIPTVDGGYLLIGTSESPVSGDKSEDSKGENDYWIIKIDESGNKQWDKTIGGSSEDYLASVISTDDGGYLLAGGSESNISGDKSEDSKGDYDYWIVKIDEQGNKQWDKTLGGSWTENLINAISTDGGYLLAGESISNTSGDKSEDSYSRGGPDYWVVKIDEQGNKVWDKTLGGTMNDIPNSGIIAVGDERYLIAGYSDSPSSGDKSENSKGGADFWIVKIDEHGNKVWDKTLGGTDFDSPYDLIATSDGSYLLTGWSISPASGDKSEDIRGDRDYWVVSIQEEAFYIKSFILVNAETNQEIGLLSDESVVNLSAIGNIKLTVRTTTVPATVDSILFELQGPVSHTQLERFKPYALFGDEPKTGSRGRNYVGHKGKPGNYTLSATPYFNGKSGASYAISFSVVYDLAVSSFTLVNADTDQDIGPLRNGDVIDLAALGNPNLSIRANTSPVTLGALEFHLDGPIGKFQIERYWPYALFGDNPKTNSATRDYMGEHFQTGQYALIAYPLLRKETGTHLFINFSVRNEQEAAGIEVFPVPSTGIVNINHKATLKDARIILQDFTGQILLSRNLSKQSVEQLDLSPYEKGIYYLKVTSSDAIEVIRLVKE